jgi:short-subunit dehydrogenase
VITGCSEGIGKAFAQELASHGVNLVMLNKAANGDLIKTANEIGLYLGVVKLYKRCSV